MSKLMESFDTASPEERLELEARLLGPYKATFGIATFPALLEHVQKEQAFHNNVIAEQFQEMALNQFVIVLAAAAQAELSTGQRHLVVTKFFLSLGRRHAVPPKFLAAPARERRLPVVGA